LDEDNAILKGDFWGTDEMHEIFMEEGDDRNFVYEEEEDQVDSDFDIDENDQQDENGEGEVKLREKKFRSV
jgi:hypothetical protein